MIPQALNAPRQLVDKLVAPMLIDVVGSQHPIRFVPGEHMEGTDRNDMDHRENRPLLASACGQAVIQAEREVPFVRAAAWANCVRPARRARFLLRVLPERCVPALSSLPGATPLQGNSRSAMPKRAMSVPHFAIHSSAPAGRPPLRHTAGQTGQRHAPGLLGDTRSDGHSQSSFPGRARTVKDCHA